MSNQSPSLHNPVCGEHESREAYKARRKASNKVGRALRTVGNGGVSSRQQFRDSMRSGGTMGKRIRAYKALMNAWAAQRVTKAKLRDEHGAVTLVGQPYELEGVHPSSRELVLEGWVDGEQFGYTVQRKWLAGISAQRGF